MKKREQLENLKQMTFWEKTRADDIVDTLKKKLGKKKKVDPKKKEAKKTKKKTILSQRRVKQPIEEILSNWFKLNNKR